MPKASRRHYQETIQTATDGITEVEVVIVHQAADLEAEVVTAAEIDKQSVRLEEIAVIGTPADEMIAESVVVAIAAHALVTGDEAIDRVVEIELFEPTVLVSAEKKPRRLNCKASRNASLKLENGLKRGRKPRIRVCRFQCSMIGKMNVRGNRRKRTHPLPPPQLPPRLRLLSSLRLGAVEMMIGMHLLPAHETQETETVIDHRGLLKAGHDPRPSDEQAALSDPPAHLVSTATSLAQADAKAPPIAVVIGPEVEIGVRGMMIRSRLENDPVQGIEAVGEIGVEIRIGIDIGTVEGKGVARERGIIGGMTGIEIGTVRGSEAGVVIVEGSRDDELRWEGRVRYLVQLSSSAKFRSEQFPWERSGKVIMTTRQQKIITKEEYLKSETLKTVFKNDKDRFPVNQLV